MNGAASMAGAPLPVPFIVGVGRSGTTLVRLMLDAHPELAIPPETGFLLRYLGWSADAAVSGAELAQTVTGFHTWNDFGLSPAAFRRALAAVEPCSLGEAVKVFYRLYAERFGKPRWGDKTPVYGQHLPEIEALVPEACFIHLLRDGRDVAASLREVWFAPTHEIGGLARYWVEQVETTQRQGGLCRRYLEVRYEDLVTRPHATLTRICDFIALPLDPAMERYHERVAGRLAEIRDQSLPDGRVVTREVRLGQHRLAGSPPDRSRIGRFRSALTGAELRTFEEVAGDLLLRLGYVVEPRSQR